MTSNERQQQQQILADTIERMRSELALMDSLQVKQVPFPDYRAVLQAFIDMSETLLQQFRSSEKDLAYIRELQEQLASLLPAAPANQPLN
jgi:hypothetical protein